MSNTRETVLNNLKAGLESINNENGYTTNIQSVTRSPVPAGFSFSGSDTPALRIIDKSESLIAKNISNYSVVETNISTEGHLKNKTNLKSDLNQMISDVRKYLASANLGSNVHYVRDGDLEISWGKDGVIFSMIVTIRYFYPRSDP